MLRQRDRLKEKEVNVKMETDWKANTVAAASATVRSKWLQLFAAVKLQSGYMEKSFIDITASENFLAVTLNCWFLTAFSFELCHSRNESCN